jgi:uncharacterized membrane protein
MNELLVDVFVGETKAEEVHHHLLKTCPEYLTDVEDTVVVERLRDGRTKVLHASRMTLPGALTGGLIGLLLGVLLLNPVSMLFGFVMGVVIGGVSGSTIHPGIHEGFMQELGTHLKPGSSALCVIVREHLGNILEELRRFNGRILSGRPSPEEEHKLIELVETKQQQPTVNILPSGGLIVPVVN